MTRRKYQRPLHVDAPFEEALERFAQTDPAEVDQEIRGDEGRQIYLHGSRVNEDAHGNICLNDLWSLAGKPENLRPTNWHRQKRAEALEAALKERIMFQKHNPSENDEITTYYVDGRGGNARTFAHPVLALDYAEALSPDIGVEVKEIFLRYRANDISLANDILDRIAEQVREDELRIQLRDQTAERNKELAEQGKQAGCEARWEYAELHNSGYRGLYNGLDADGIHKLKKLTKSQKILDHMSAAETAANAFWITQAALRMKRDKPQTPEEAFDIASEAGARTRKAMEEIGGVMPEDMPVADGISEARKRLKKNKEVLGPGKKPDKKG